MKQQHSNITKHDLTSNRRILQKFLQEEGHLIINFGSMNWYQSALNTINAFEVASFCRHDIMRSVFLVSGELRPSWYIKTSFSPASSTFGNVIMPPAHQSRHREVCGFCKLERGKKNAGQNFRKSKNRFSREFGLALNNLVLRTSLLQWDMVAARHQSSEPMFPVSKKTEVCSLIYVQGSKCHPLFTLKNKHCRNSTAFSLDLSYCSLKGNSIQADT